MEVVSGGCWMAFKTACSGAQFLPYDPDGQLKELSI